jgi:DNA uptake protein ComE-like DNA-binding protein
MVGPERAPRLIEARPLNSWQDVERVPGFDCGMVDDLKSGGARMRGA